MYKVVIIDDNVVLLKSLMCSVDWESLRCQCTGTAADGIAGKSLIERTHPDIILTDIRMPGIDGLEMIKTTRRLLPYCKIIIITGYERFDYAKKALQLNVDEFLLKPIDIQELTKTIKDQVKKLDQASQLRAKQQHEAEQYLRQARLLKNNSYIRKTYALYQLLNSESGYSSSALTTLSEENISDTGYVIAVVKKQFPDGEFSNEEIKQIRTAVFRHYMGKRPLELVAFIFDKQLILTGFASHQHGNSSTKEIARILRITLQEQLFSGQICAFEISQQLDAPLSQFGTICRHALESLQKKLYFVGNEAYSEYSNNIPAPLSNPLSADLAQRLEQLLTTHDPAEASQLIQDTIHDVVIRYGGNISLVENAMLLFCIMITSQMIPPAFYTEELSFEEVSSKIKSIQNIQMLTDYILSLYFLCCEKRSSDRPSYSLLVQSFYQYVRENAGKNLTLTEIASYLSVSPNYLSSLIKKETGENFTDIIIRSKMELSKKYLQNVSYRIEEVAELVGYSNYISFYKAFKKCTGMTPKQYRQYKQEGTSLC